MKKILLVSTYLLFLKRNKALLMKRGFQIFTTSSGLETLKLLEEHHFDMILIDFKLEDMGGCTLCALIREREDSRDVPIILTCHNIPGSIERVQQCEATTILIKPIDPINLMETVGSFLNMEIGRSKRVVLKIDVLSKAYEQEFSCFSHDISNTGILIETDYQLPLESRIICKFTLPDICDVEAEGEVTRFMTAQECENLYGIKFVALPLSYRRAIDNYIAAISTEGYSA